MYAKLCRQSNKPSESWDKMAFQRKQRFRQLCGSSRKQIGPIVSKRERVKRYLQTKADP